MRRQTFKRLADKVPSPLKGLIQSLHTPSPFSGLGFTGSHTALACGGELAQQTHIRENSNFMLRSHLHTEATEAGKRLIHIIWWKAGVIRLTVEPGRAA